jgi:glycosyl transferase family 2
VTQICFVGTRAGNYFMNELLATLADEAAAEGVRVSTALDHFPVPEASTAYVVIPHEFYACAPRHGWPSREQLSRTIAFCTEQPETKWFDLSASLAERMSAAVDIQPSGVAELRRRGIGAERFRIGYAERWDAWHRDESVERPVDVLYMGSRNPRRDWLLAAYGSTLWRRQSMLLVPPESPKPQARQDFLVEDAKRARLRGSKVLVNLHRGVEPYFEWVRVVEAICNGCVVISEHSVDTEPLVPGDHFLSGRAADLGFFADRVSRDPERLRGIRLAAYDHLRSELPMRDSVRRLVAIAEDVSTTPRLRRPHLGSPARGLRDLRERPPEPAVPDPLRQARKRKLLARIESDRREQARREAPESPDPGGAETLHRTPGYERVSPRISICVPLYNHEHFVGSALASAARSEFPDYELLVLDDASTDGSADAVTEFLRARAWLPALLAGRHVNQGLGRGRNDLVAMARGEFVFMLDADNEIYPPALERLLQALEADPKALFAYSMLEAHQDGQPVGLVSSLPWDIELLRRGNYIDAMSLLRRRELMELGGYTEELLLHGWEDFELWCRLAEIGGYGVLVPEILGRYRFTDESMISLTNIDISEMWSLLCERYPRFLAGAPLPTYPVGVRPPG